MALSHLFVLCTTDITTSIPTTSFLNQLKMSVRKFLQKKTKIEHFTFLVLWQNILAWPVVRLGRIYRLLPAMRNWNNHAVWYIKSLFICRFVCLGFVLACLFVRRAVCLPTFWVVFVFYTWRNVRNMRKNFFSSRIVFIQLRFRLRIFVTCIDEISYGTVSNMNSRRLTCFWTLSKNHNVSSLKQPGGYLRCEIN